MKYAVEARIFGDNRIVAKVRSAEDGETSGYTQTRTCDIWVDVFENEDEAISFKREYRR